MKKLHDLLKQNASAQASKAATDLLWKQEVGADVYCLVGKIFVGCGIGWALLSLIPIACKSPIRDCLWMWVLAAIQILLGTVLVVLSKKSRNFQEWAYKDFQKGLKEKKKLEEKAKIGNMKLPITNGDVLAIKFLGVIAVVFIVIMLIGIFCGWVVW